MNTKITDGHFIERIEINEDDDNMIIVRCVGEDNLYEMVKHIENYKGNVY